AAGSAERPAGFCLAASRAASWRFPRASVCSWLGWVLPDLRSELLARVQQGLCFGQVARSEALGEGPIDTPKLLKPRALLRTAIELGEGQLSPQLEGSRPLLPGDLERPREGSPGFGGVDVREKLATHAVQVRGPRPLVAHLDES